MWLVCTWAGSVRRPAGCPNVLRFVRNCVEVEAVCVVAGDAGGVVFPDPRAGRGDGVCKLLGERG